MKILAWSFDFTHHLIFNFQLSDVVVSQHGALIV